MEINDIKLIALNGAVGVVTMTNLEVWLKVILLVVTIGYTLSKWIKIRIRLWGESTVMGDKTNFGNYLDLTSTGRENPDKTAPFLNRSDLHSSL